VQTLPHQVVVKDGYGMWEEDKRSKYAFFNELQADVEMMTIKKWQN